MISRLIERARRSGQGASRGGCRPPRMWSPDRLDPSFRLSRSRLARAAVTAIVAAIVASCAAPASRVPTTTNGAVSSAASSSASKFELDVAVIVGSSGVDIGFSADGRFDLACNPEAFLLGETDDVSETVYLMQAVAYGTVVTCDIVRGPTNGKFVFAVTRIQDASCPGSGCDVPPLIDVESSPPGLDLRFRYVSPPA